MQVTRIELSNLRTNSENQSYTAQLRFYLTNGSGDADELTQITSLNCRMLMLDVETRQAMHDGLLRDAIRQLQWMPEVRFGTVSLTDLPEMTEIDQNDAAA